MLENIPGTLPFAKTGKLRALAVTDLKQRLATMGADGVGNTPRQFAEFIKAEIPKWAKVVKDAGLKVE